MQEGNLKEDLEDTNTNILRGVLNECLDFGKTFDEMDCKLMKRGMSFNVKSKAFLGGDDKKRNSRMCYFCRRQPNFRHAFYKVVLTITYSSPAVPAAL